MLSLQVTAAQVETYQTKKYADDSPSAPDPQDSSRSASPGPNMWKSPRGFVPGHVPHDTHTTGKHVPTFVSILTKSIIPSVYPSSAWVTFIIVLWFPDQSSRSSSHSLCLAKALSLFTVVLCML